MENWSISRPTFNLNELRYNYAKSVSYISSPGLYRTSQLDFLLANGIVFDPARAGFATVGERLIKVN